MWVLAISEALQYTYFTLVSLCKAWSSNSSDITLKYKLNTGKSSWFSPAACKCSNSQN